MLTRTAMRGAGTQTPGPSAVGRLLRVANGRALRLGNSQIVFVTCRNSGCWIFHELNVLRASLMQPGLEPMRGHVGMFRRLALMLQLLWISRITITGVFAAAEAGVADS
jgi:hypothetical protein